jgi:Flp pilus assembly protein TadG
MRSVTGQRGQSLLEFALLAPFVLFFLLALVDFGIAIDRRIVLDHAVREGARFASVGGQALNDGAAASIPTVQAYTSAQSQGVVSPSDVQLCYSDVDVPTNGFGLGDTVKVSVTYGYDYVSGFDSLPGITIDPTIPMNASASARAEYAISSVDECLP